jgi:hypothetical protein
VESLGKAALATPLYISFAWILMVSYQLFTQTAVKTVVVHIGIFWPSVSAWLTSRMDMIVFIYAFAWVFLLSSAVPSVILGKERGVLAQFFVCLIITFVAFVVQDIISTYRGGPIDELFRLTALFHNPFLAVGYLLTPYILMLVLDIRSKRKRAEEETLEKEIANRLHVPS